MKKEIVKTQDIPEGVDVRMEDHMITVKGDKGEITRSFEDPVIAVSVEGKQVVFKATNATKREKMRIGTFNSHMNNMLRGVKEPFIYKMKICAGHFPMNVSIQNNEISIKNFLGEKIPRKIQLDKDVDVKVDGEHIIITHADREKAGLTAGRIEQLTKIKGRDRRIFQDGIYITEKPR